MFLSDISVRRPVLATVMSILLVAFGVLSFANLPLRELPDVDPPIVSVETLYRGASAAVVESRVTKPLEDRIAGIEGIRTVSSESAEGTSRITIEFQLSREMEAAANDVRDRVSQALDDLPEEADPPEVFKADSEARPIMWLDLSSETASTLQLTDYAERNVTDRFAVIDGVARVVISGAREYAMRIWLDRIALAARQLTVADVEAALRAQNVELPAGRLESRQRDFTVRIERAYTTPEDFRSLVLARGDDEHLIRLGEVARIEIGARDDKSEFRGNGTPRVGLGIIKQSNANTVRVARQVHAEIARIQPGLPAEIRLESSWDSSEFVRSSVREVYITLAVAMSLVVFVIYLFLGTKRAAIVPAITVPICLIGTATALYGFGLSINLLTLLALVLSIGLVVDDSIVVLENVQRRIDLGERPLVAAFRGAREVAFAVIATTLVVIAVFVPIAFLEGLTGRLFRELAVTVSAAVAISSFVALSLSAMLCSKLLTSREPERGLARKAHALVGALQRRYEGALRIWLGHPRIIGAGLVVILVGIGLLFSRVPLELEPPEDRGAFMVMMRAPEGASFDYSVAHMRELEEKVLFPLLERGVATNVLSRVPFGYRSTAMNSGMNVIVLAPWNEREESAHSLMSEVAQKAGQVPGIFAIPIGYSGMGRSGSDRPVQLVIGGSDHDEVGAWQERVIAAARDIPGLRGPRGDYQPTKPQMRVEIDRSRAGDLGVSVAAIGRTLETMLGSARVTTYIDRGEEYDVVLQAEPAQRASPTDLSNLYVRSERTDELIPLSNLVALREVAEPGTLRRFNRLPAATVAASVAEGHALGDVLAALENLARSELPAAAHFDYKGESLDFVESSNAAYFTFTLALLIVFLVLAAQFESFVHPLVIMLTVPLAVAGGLLGLVLTDGTLNIYSQIGMTILIGLAAKNGILIVEFANQLRAQGRGFDQAVVEAARTRLRPILMTGISTAIGALPLVLASGAGSGGRQTIGVVVFGGVLFATLFTLVVVPVAYSVLARGTKLPGTVERQLERYEGAEPGGVASAH